LAEAKHPQPELRLLSEPFSDGAGSSSFSWLAFDSGRPAKAGTPSTVILKDQFDMQFWLKYFDRAGQQPSPEF
jgi:hypothetical protein